MQERGFGSDNNSGIHPAVLEAIIKADCGHTPAYGDDPYTESVWRKFKDNFGLTAETFFVTTGTAANVLALSACTQSWNSIICARTSHLHVDECGAPSKFTGCTMIQIDGENGKLTVPLIEPHVCGFGDKHHPQPKVISVAQPTEFETVYTRKELCALADFAHKHKMLFHIDGARFANAVVSLNEKLSLARDSGVDVLSFGGTKNGAMLAESVIFFEHELAEKFKYIQKQGMQTVSKTRFIAAQFDALLSNELWRKNALHANEMAALLARTLREETGYVPEYPVEANSVFVRFGEYKLRALHGKWFFYDWDSKGLCRFMASFDTTEDDVTALIEDIKKY
ncbi:MAG: low specificity L-threonine aldolase [Parcubacteria group bacterium]|nr:low specificity L-threonine aldolase [Parcubacteria group bacterium]